VNTTIFYFEDTYLYSINLKKAKQLVVSQDRPFYTLFYYPKYLYKFFYVIYLNNFYFFFMKNIDYLGEGNFLFNIPDLKDIMVYQKSDYIFVDDTHNEIFYYNVKTSEIKKILENSALKILSFN